MRQTARPFPVAGRPAENSGGVRNRRPAGVRLPGVRGSLLVVSQFYPPSAMVAARRPSGLTKYLRRLGYRVTVLTSAAWVDGTPAEEPGVLRTGDLMASRLNWRRANMRAWAGGAGAADYEAGTSRLAAAVVPDTTLITWLPYLIPSALRLARRERFDCIVTTSGPESAHLAGLALSRRTAWIADLRDGWGFETLHSWPTGAPDPAGRRLERHVARRADVMTAVTEPLAADLRDRLGADAHAVTNGYDPEDVPERTGASSFLDPDRISLVHTGRMASSQRSPAAILDAVRLLRERGSRPAERLQLIFAGPVTSEERRLIGAADLEGAVATQAISAARRRCAYSAKRMLCCCSRPAPVAERRPASSSSTWGRSGRSWYSARTAKPHASCATPRPATLPPPLNPRR